MCDACEHGIQAAQQMEQQIIDQRGFSIRAIPTDTEVGTFCYTVGRSPAKAEFYVNKLHPQQGAMLINGLCDLVDSGKFVPSHGAITHDLIGDKDSGTTYPVKILAIEPRDADMAGPVMRNQYYSPEAYQLIWPDANGLLPGDEGHNEAYDQVTFPLGVERIYAEHDKDGQPVPDTAMCSKHVHRGEEFSHPLGVSMHIPTEQSGLKCQLCDKANP